VVEDFSHVKGPVEEKAREKMWGLEEAGVDQGFTQV
jgi:hypothetical protein